MRSILGGATRAKTAGALCGKRLGVVSGSVRTRVLAGGSRGTRVRGVAAACGGVVFAGVVFAGVAFAGVVFGVAGCGTAPGAEARVLVPPAAGGSVSAGAEEAPVSLADLPDFRSWPMPEALQPSPDGSVPADANAALKACLAAIEGEAKDDADFPEGARDVDPGAPFRGCFAAGKRVWGVIAHVSEYRLAPMLNPVALSECQENGGCPVEALWEGRAVFFDENGAGWRSHDLTATGGLSDGRLAVFDHDGDGTEELALIDDEGVLLRFQDGSVTRSPATAGLRFVAVVDEDGDPIPDLKLANPYSAAERIGCGIRFSLPLSVPHVEVNAVAHGLAGGTFSTKDGVATRRVRAVCPAPPGKIVPKDGEGHVRQVEAWTSLACARLWGVEASAVKAAVDAACGQEPQDASLCDDLFAIQSGEKTFPYCVAREWTDPWITAAPPLVLR